MSTRNIFSAPEAELSCSTKSSPLAEPSSVTFSDTTGEGVATNFLIHVAPQLVQQTTQFDFLQQGSQLIEPAPAKFPPELEKKNHQWELRSAAESAAASAAWLFAV